MSQAPKPMLSAQEQSARDLGAAKLGLPPSEVELSWGRTNRLGHTNFSVHTTEFADDWEGDTFRGLHVVETDELLTGDAALSAVVAKVMPTLSSPTEAETVLTTIKFYWRGFVDGAILLADTIDAQQAHAAYPDGTPPVLTMEGKAMVIRFCTVQTEGDLTEVFSHTLRIEEDGRASLK